MTDPTASPSRRAPIVLVANDQEWSARSLETILTGEGYEVIRAYTGSQAIEKARAHNPDAALLDQQMPDLSGLDVCRILRADPRFGPTVPIMITTAGPSSRTNRLDALAAGAWDFVPQPIDGEQLLLRLKNFLASKVAVDQLRDDGMVDPDTGLYNAQGFARRVAEIAADAARRQSALTCVVVAPELSGGNGALDEALETARQLSGHVAGVLQHTARAADVVGRIGPLQFAVVANTGEQGAHRLVERYRAALGTRPFEAAGASPSSVGLRAGICVSANSGDPLDPLEMVQRAVEALGAPLAQVRAGA